MRRVVATAVGLSILVGSCSKREGFQSKDAVRGAIETHLQQRPNVVLTNMTLEVEDVQFSGDRAEARAKFRSKQSPDLAVGVRYLLRRTGDRWEVTSSSPTSGMGMGPHADSASPTSVPPPTTPTPQSSH